MSLRNDVKNESQRSVGDIKEQSENASALDLDLTAKFEEGRQIAIAEGKAVLSGYFQGRLEVAEFIKAEIVSKPINLQAASYALPAARSQSSIRALFYGEEDA